MHNTGMAQRGFTLIEMSVVLVIIGLIVGGILVGQNLINAAAVRAQITQIEKYNTAANTFYGKYGALPGDMNAATASQFGFAARGQYAGEGDGNGLIEGIRANNGGSNLGYCIDTGEAGLFWVDLSTVNLIDGSFNTATATSVPAIPVSNLGAYFPPAKLGNGNYVYVWSGGWQEQDNNSGNDGANYFGIQGMGSFSTQCFPDANSGGMTVSQAYSIDAKIDDGLPQSGNVMALEDISCCMWAGNTAMSGPFTTATSGSSTSCFDNGGTAGATQQYSMKQNGGSGANCALTFKMQAGR